MARVQIAARALRELERLFDFLVATDPSHAQDRIESVRHGMSLLADHPLIGRPAEDGRRELVLARGRFGYVARYRWIAREDLVLVLAVRHQREAGYPDEV